MRVLRLGVNGDDVTQWQTFLVGQGIYEGEVDGDFGPDTKQATIDFQRWYGLEPDGVVGDGTFGVAMQHGLSIAKDNQDTREEGPNWPPPTVSPMSNAEKVQVFGQIAYVSAPTPTNREAIKITNGWDKQNIVMVDIPQLAKFGHTKVAFHKLGAYQLQQLWAEWESLGLLDLVLSWDGSYNPRFVRGSTQYLSNHAYGTAFDVNATWNLLGHRPALVGEKGSTRKLVESAVKWGWYWGGHGWTSNPSQNVQRLDGMHFELREVISEIT